MICKLGYNIHWDKGILDRPCHVCGETDCEESPMFNGWGDDEDEEGLIEPEAVSERRAEKLSLIFSEISRERKRQDEKWGEQNHPMTKSKSIHDVYKPLAQKYKIDNFVGREQENISWHTIILQKFYEAFAETEPEKQREEMVQVAAVAVQIIECLDRCMEEKNELQLR